MYLFRLICLLCFLFLVPLPAAAQEYSTLCDQVESTAATLGCLKKRLENAQKRLNTVYQGLSATMSGEKLTELQTLQQTWLAYRDAECMWEAERSATSALKRINELFCMARITEDRVDVLSVIYNDNVESGSHREYGSFPRWMNVLAKDYPDIYWYYGKRAGFDLDCDGEDEYVMQGVSTRPAVVSKSEAVEDEKPVSTNYTKNVVVAIAQNPLSGRPKATIFKFPVQQGGMENSICSDTVVIELGKSDSVDKTEDKTRTDGAEPPKCMSYLKLSGKNCPVKTISWNSKDFVLDRGETEPAEPVKANKKEETKKAK